MNRGTRAEKIFSHKQDYTAFLELTRESVEMWNVRIGAYCPMPHQYHMLIQTPEANLRQVENPHTRRPAIKRTC
jgi:putative transposase